MAGLLGDALNQVPGLLNQPPMQMGKGLLSQIRPLNAGEFVDNHDGSHSTERTATVMMPGGWANVPTLWHGPAGPTDLRNMTDDQLARFVQTFEEFRQLRFLRHRMRQDAERSAKARSDAGGAGSGQPRYQTGGGR